MDYVLTLIGKNISPLAEAARERFGGNLAWLNPDEACDIAPLPLIHKEKLAALVGTHPACDFAFQPLHMRKKKLLVSDMDSTLIHQETIDMLASLVGAEKEVAALTEQAMQGEINFATALAKRVQLLRGIKESAFEKVLNKIEVRAGAQQLTATMKQNGASCLLLTGGFDILAAPIAERTGFEKAECNKLEFLDGALSGRLIAPIYDQSSKKKQMLEKAAALNLAPELIIAVGDGANDIDMIEAAALGVCFGDKPVLADRADCQIKHNDLTALLYIQGYSKSEFV